MTKATLSQIDAIAETLAGYAERCIFQGFSRGAVAGTKQAEFRFVWHRGHSFDLVVDSRRCTLRLNELLPGVPADSTMYEELKAFIKARQSDDLPEHRRIDRRRVQIRTYNRAGSVSLVLTVKDGDCQYAVTKLVHLMNEVHLTFLNEGKYFDYLVETFSLDPDHM